MTTGTCGIISLAALTFDLGFVVCYVASKRIGIRSTEIFWAYVKQHKDGSRFNLGGSSLEK